MEANQGGIKGTLGSYWEHPFAWITTLTPANDSTLSALHLPISQFPIWETTEFYIWFGQSLPACGSRWISFIKHCNNSDGLHKPPALLDLGGHRTWSSSPRLHQGNSGKLGKVERKGKKSILRLSLGIFEKNNNIDTNTLKYCMCLFQILYCMEEVWTCKVKTNSILKEKPYSSGLCTSSKYNGAWECFLWDFCCSPKQIEALYMTLKYLVIRF